MMDAQGEERNNKKQARKEMKKWGGREGNKVGARKWCQPAQLLFSKKHQDTSRSILTKKYLFHGVVGVLPSFVQCFASLSHSLIPPKVFLAVLQRGN
jgi:hypothetical protein